MEIYNNPNEPNDAVVLMSSKIHNRIDREQLFVYFAYFN